MHFRHFWVKANELCGRTPVGKRYAMSVFAISSMASCSRETADTNNQTLLQPRERPVCERG